MHINALNLAEATKKAMMAITTKGSRVSIDRDHATDKDTKELTPAFITIENPEHSIYIGDERAPNPFATLYEILWVFAGRNDVEPLSFFIPRAPDYADDGEYWRAGYGPRLRRHIGTGDGGYETGAPQEVVDQIDWIIETLKADPSSRRAVMTIWDPAKECTIGQSKDFPCTDLVQFLVRDGKLNCTVYMRSNDVLFGFSGINVAEWTFLQTMLAKHLGLKVGMYNHISNSLHYYEKFADKVGRCMEGNIGGINVKSFFSMLSGVTAFAKMDKDFYKALIENFNDSIETPIENLKIKASLVSLSDNGMIATPVGELMTYINLYILFKRDKEAFAEVYEECISRVRHSDMFIATIHFFLRQVEKDKSKATIEYISIKGHVHIIEETVKLIKQGV